MRQCFALALLPVLAGACGGTPSKQAPVLFDKGSGVRTVREVRYDTVWHYGGVRDTLFAHPGKVAAAPDGAVYVLDMAVQKVIRFSPDGEVDWVWGTKGEGPGEIQNVRAFDVGPDGGIVLADSHNCRLVFLSSEGSLVHERGFVCDAPLIEGIAVLASGDVVLDTSGDIPWIIQTVDGYSTPLEVPWSGFVDRPFLERYGLVSSWGNTWVFGFATGNGWFVSDHGVMVDAFPYVEHTDFPETVVTRSRDGDVVRTVTGTIERPSVAAWDLEVWNDTLLVLARDQGGISLLDKYSVRGGGYLYSHTLPGEADNIAVYGNTLFIIDRQDFFSYVTALRAQQE